MRITSVIIAFVAVLVLVAPVAAQDGYDCVVNQVDNKITLDCTRKTTPTPEPTATSVFPSPTPTVEATATATATEIPPTATATVEPTATATATNTPVPPTATATATSAPPTATSVPQPVAALRVNVPLLNVVSGDPGLDANNRAIVWAGKIADDGNYFQLRIVGSESGLHLYTQQMRRRPQAGEQVTINVNGKTFSTAYKQPGDWGQTERCGDGECRGWSASIVVPWSEVGGKPSLGDEWALSASHLGAEWKGTLQWGERANYAGSLPANAVIVDVPLLADATLGGSTDCGDWAGPEGYFPFWGDANLEDLSANEWWGISEWGQWKDASPGFDPLKYSRFWSVQNQWDTADWPCYSRYIAKWSLPQLPEGAVLTGAWLHAYKFGHSGYIGENTGVNVMQAWQVGSAWSEGSVTWNNAPIALEAVSRTPVGECKAANCAPGDWHSFDVSEIVRRAYKVGEKQASVMLYSSAGQYHSGRYFDSREGSAPPLIRIAYVLSGQPTVVPTVAPTKPPTVTPRPTSTVTPLPTSTAPPTATPVVPTATPTKPAQATGCTWYVTKTGNDGADGKTLATGWSTFNRAWRALMPGETLCIGDGTYTQKLQPNVRNGEPGKPITVRALNDGMVILDGRGSTPVQIGDTWPNLGPDAAWWVFEGIVAKNGGESVWSIRGHDLVFRRISGYDADKDGNSAIIWPDYSKNILIEDCIAAGTGRKTIIVFSSEDVTVRRCYSDWKQWDGLTFCGVPWPGGNGPHIYNGHRIRFENVISVGPVPDRAIAITNQSDTATVTGIEVLGSMAIGAGRTASGQPYPYPYPGPGACGNDTNYQFYPGENAGFVVYGQGPIVAPVFKDVLATNNAREGFGIIRPYGTGGQNVTLDHATLWGNGQDLRPDGQLTVTASCIGSKTCTGGGARLTHRYVDGALTTQPLWPWPMDSRAEKEIGINITQWANQYVNR